MELPPWTEAEARALDARCGRAASFATRRTVAKLKAVPPDQQVAFLGLYTEWDLENLIRCALAAQISCNSRIGDTPILCYAAKEGRARALKALLDGGANVKLVDTLGCTALHWAAGKNDSDCMHQAAPRRWR